MPEAELGSGNLVFLLDTKLGPSIDAEPWSDVLPAAGIEAVSTTDLAKPDAMVADHGPGIAFMPVADFRCPVAKGHRHYRSFAIAVISQHVHAAIYGAFRPYFFTGVQRFFHDLDQLSAGA